MGRRLILDTCVLIAAERGKLQLADFVVSDDDIALPMIVLTELRMGVLLADDRHRSIREAAADRVQKLFPILEYSTSVSEAHAELLAWTRRNGSPRGPFDLIIAASAAATGRTLITSDRTAVFAALPGVTVDDLTLR